MDDGDSSGDFSLTPSAWEEIDAMLERTGRLAARLNVHCRGQYEMRLVNEINEFDRVYLRGRTMVVCDPRSHIYLEDMVLDYLPLFGCGFQLAWRRDQHAADDGRQRKIPA